MTVQKNHENIIYGEQNFMIPSHMNYGKFAIDRMLTCKDKIALINGLTGEEIRFGELVQLIVNTASALINSGVKRGEVIGICSENRSEFLITAVAGWSAGATVTLLNAAYSKMKRGEVIGICSENRSEFLITAVAGWSAGATVTLLNAAYSKNELVHSMNISKPKYIFLSPDTYAKFYQTMVGTKLVNKFYLFGNSVNDPQVINFEDLTKTYFDVAKFQPPMDPNGLSQTALILYTSGTTGLPKGAKLTQLNLLTAGNQPYGNSTKALRSLSIAPFANTVGIFSTMKELTCQRTVIFMSRFVEERYLSCIEKHKAAMLIAVPPLVVLLTKSRIIKNYDVSSVELIFCGGAPLDLAVMADAKRIFPNLIRVQQGYGMTEASGALAKETATHFRTGSVGKVMPGLIAKIVDVETRKALGPNQEGEVCIKGPALFGGYIGKDMSEDLDEDGFFKTGDICYYDEDGYLFFVDRIKELIKYKAGQVAPSELEALLLQHPAVQDAGVVGKPDAVAGELPTAFVVKKPGVSVTEKELIDFVADKVSSWKQLRGGVYFLEAIPKVPSGKILRRTLRDLLKKTPSKL